MSRDLWFLGRYIARLCAIAVCVAPALAAAGQEASAQLPKNAGRTRPTVATQDCISGECHGALLARKVIHDPVARQKCLDCHVFEDASQHRFKVSDNAAQGCTRCHQQIAPKPGEAFSVHAPAQDNCLACHDPHGSDVKHILKLAAPELCLSCHENLKDSLASSSVVHGAMTQEGTCLNCHNPHFSKLSKLQKEPQPQQCLECHNRAIATADGRTLTDMAALLKDNPEHHGPIRLGACTACHQPHAGKEAKLLAAAYPPAFYAPFNADLYRLCFTCHSPDLVLQPQATALTGFNDGKKNLHWVHVDQQKGRTCRACHEVHASRQPFHIRDSVPFGPGGWALTIKYTQTPTGGTCGPACHAERSYDHGDRPRSIPFVALTAKGQALLNADSPKPTSVIAPADGPGSYVVPAPPFTPGVFPCTGCHDPNQAVNTVRRVVQKPHQDIQLHHDEENRWCLDCHNAQNRDVLRSASGEPIPFSESYRLCGQCHGLQYRDWKAGVHGKRTGEWNGQRQYLLCVNCHDPHSPKFKALQPLPPPLRPTAQK